MLFDNDWRLKAMKSDDADADVTAAAAAVAADDEQQPQSGSVMQCSYFTCNPDGSPTMRDSSSSFGSHDFGQDSGMVVPPAPVPALSPLAMQPDHADGVVQAIQTLLTRVRAEAAAATAISAAATAAIGEREWVDVCIRRASGSVKEAETNTTTSTPANPTPPTPPQPPHAQPPSPSSSPLLPAHLPYQPQHEEDAGTAATTAAPDTTPAVPSAATRQPSQSAEDAFAAAAAAASAAAASSAAAAAAADEEESGDHARFKQGCAHAEVSDAGREWANGLIKATWPYVAEHICSVVRKQLDGTLEKVVGGALRLASMDLGEAAPQVERASVRHLEDERIRADLAVDWDAEVDVVIDAGYGTSQVGVCAGIDTVKVCGDLTIILGPPCPAPPYFNAVHVFFANPPSVALGLTGLGMLASSFPGVNGSLHLAVADGLRNILVLPKRISVTLNQQLPPLESARHRSPPPPGFFSVCTAELWGCGGVEELAAAAALRITVGGRSVRVALGGSDARAAAAATVDSIVTVHCDTQYVDVEVVDEADCVLARASPGLRCGDLRTARTLPLLAPGEEDTAAAAAAADAACVPPAAAAAAAASSPVFPAAAAASSAAAAAVAQATPSLRLEATWHSQRPEASALLAACPASLVSAELGGMELAPPPPSKMAPLRVRLAPKGVPAVESCAGTVKWAKADGAARSDLLLGVLERMDNLGLGLNVQVAADVTGLSVALIEQYGCLEPGGVPAWLELARAEHIEQAATRTPYFNDTLHSLMPAGEDEVRLELVAADGTVLAAYDGEVGVGRVLGERLHFVPLDPRIGTTTCALTARVARSKVYC